AKLTEGITAIFTKRKLDQAALDEREDLLIAADLGPATAAGLVAELKRTRFDQEGTPEEARGTLAESIAALLELVAQPLVRDRALRRTVVLVVGGHGTGKPTAIRQLAQHFRAAGKKVTLVAGDTFRAAAIEQLKIWGERVGAAVLARETGADAAG